MSVQSEVIQECIRIAFNPDETPARRRKAEKWLERLTESTGNNWGNGGVTVAEAAGIVPESGAPGA